MPKLAVLLVVALGACAHATIAGTSVRDTPDNREIYDVVIKANDALAARDAEALLALVSPRYFEDNGTAQQDDDYGFAELRDKMLPESMALAKEIQLAVEIQNIVVAGDSAHADVRYQSRAKLELPSGSKWDTHKEFNRLELAREDDAWKITSGL